MGVDELIHQAPDQTLSNCRSGFLPTPLELGRPFFNDRAGKLRVIRRLDLGQDFFPERQKLPLTFGELFHLLVDHLCHVRRAAHLGIQPKSCIDVFFELRELLLNPVSFHKKVGALDTDVLSDVRFDLIEVTRTQ
ncbi:MAG: hypothetical protein NDJ89_14315 [Oligoflexia bacterium]|nr:hypothetical protein [Oligoflexia bacterium]